MCRRLLRFTRSSVCRHLTFTSDSYIDCRSKQCYLSTSHPPNCGSPQSPCNCRRYYGFVLLCYARKSYPQLVFFLVYRSESSRMRWIQPFLLFEYSIHTAFVGAWEMHPMPALMDAAHRITLPFFITSST